MSISQQRLMPDPLEAIDSPMVERPKRGSSRRKGDEFQDLTALRLILELYISGEDFQAFLEYEKATAIDDIVIFSSNRMRAVQAKYAIDPLAVYSPADFTSPESRTYFGRYAAGWKKARENHPAYEFTAELLSNRGRDSTLEGIIDADGRFVDKFVQGEMRKEAKTFRDTLKKVCALDDDDKHEENFRAFLNAFQFRLGQRPLNELRSHLEGELLDHQLGISDRSVFHELKELIEEHAIELHDPITRNILDAIFRRVQRRFLLSQVFPVDEKHFIEVPAFRDSLLAKINATDGGYIVVTGLPGSGKSTSLSEFFDSIEGDPRFATCRYFCFVRPNDDSARLRLEAETLRVNLLSELQDRFSDSLDRRFDFGEHRFTEVLAELGADCASQGRKLLLLLDGLDHAERDPLVRDSVLRALPTALPPGVVIIAGSQELKNWEPLALRRAREQSHVAIPLFGKAETRAYLIEKHGLSLDDVWVDRIHSKSLGLPLYLRYVAVFYLDLASRGQSTVVVSQTWSEIHKVNEAVRQQLQVRNLIGSDEHKVVSLERLDLTNAQKRERRFYNAETVLVFNQDCGRFCRGESAQLVAVTDKGLIVVGCTNTRMIPRRWMKCRRPDMEIFVITMRISGANFERDGMEHARYVCGVSACLRFPVAEAELADFQNAIPTADVPSAVRAVAHLLRSEEGQVSIFHDSFRVFVNGKLDTHTRRQITRDIHAKLKAERGSVRWFSYTFEYALEAEDYEYVLAEVNSSFVDFALQHCRPAEDILTAIKTAARSATKTADLVALARLAPLHFRTNERLRDFDYGDLARVQLALGRVGDVLGFCCRPHEHRWLVEDRVAEQVMVWCAETGHKELGRRLFAIYNDTHESAPSAAVLANYASRPSRVLQWLAGIKSRPDILERLDPFLPGYAPPLATFLKQYFLYGPADGWRHFKKIKRLFSNHLVRHLLLRLVANHRPQNELALELEDYLANTAAKPNLEVAGYAVLAGFSAARVRELAGPVILPPKQFKDHTSHNVVEGDFDRFQWTALILGYENDPVAIGRALRRSAPPKPCILAFFAFSCKLASALGGPLQIPFAVTTVTSVRLQRSTRSPKRGRKIRLERWMSYAPAVRCCPRLYFG